MSPLWRGSERGEGSFTRKFAVPNKNASKLQNSKLRRKKVVFVLLLRCFNSFCLFDGTIPFKTMPLPYVSLLNSVHPQYLL